MLSVIAGLAISSQMYLHKPPMPIPGTYQVKTIHTSLPTTSSQVKNLPKRSKSLSTVTVSNITINAGDNSVKQTVINAAGDIIKQSSLPILKQYINALPTSAVNIVLFSSEKSYGDALLKAGASESSIPAYTQKTGGITVGSEIWVPLYNLSDLSELSNVLTHELTHVTFNQMGIGDKLPTWINEGAAWRDGLLAQQKYNSFATMEEMVSQQMSVLQAAGSSQLLPLTASEDDIINASYNVEYEDFMAIEALVKQYGADQFLAFLSSTSQKDVAQAFQDTYKTDIQSYQDAFLQSF